MTFASLALGLALALGAFALGTLVERYRARRRVPRRASSPRRGAGDAHCGADAALELRRLLGERERAGEGYEREAWDAAGLGGERKPPPSAAALNALLASLWPSVAAASSSTLAASLAPALRRRARSSGGLVSSAALSRCDLGLVPPVLTSVVAEERAAGSDAVRVRARVEWDAFADVRLDVTLVGGAVVNLMLDELSFAGDIELTFAPLFDEWPCFEGVRAYVAPDCSLDFACRAGKGGYDLAAVPLLDAWLRDGLRAAFAGVGVWLSRDGSRLWWEGEATGGAGVRPRELDERAAGRVRGAHARAAAPARARRRERRPEASGAAGGGVAGAAAGAGGGVAGAAKMGDAAQGEQQQAGACSPRQPQLRAAAAHAHAHAHAHTQPRARNGGGDAHAAVAAAHVGSPALRSVVVSSP